jgi:hypothetical protein
MPPLYIGEIALFLGVLVVARSGYGLAMLASLPSILLVLLISLVTIRTIPYFGIYGMDAARDSVVATYGIFSFVIICLLLEKPDRIIRVLNLYGVFVAVYCFYAFLYFTLAYLGYLSRYGPNFPGTQIPFLSLRPGESASHLAGAAVFALLGLCRVGWTWAIAMFFSISIISISRGAMLACILPIMLAAFASHQKRRFGIALCLGGVLFALAYSADVSVSLPGGRSIGPAQMVSGIESILGYSETANLDGTKRFRLNWWDTIINYTFNGPYFWTGKGFGVSLAEVDGFLVGLELGGPPVRSPHNVNMTILARAGVPGLFIWLSTCLAWFFILFYNMIIARHRGELAWANIFLWVSSYGAAILIDALFDVALEGPMLGIWFWCIFGFGIAATMIYRAGAKIEFGHSASYHQARH